MDEAQGKMVSNSMVLTTTTTPTTTSKPKQAHTSVRPSPITNHPSVPPHRGESIEYPYTHRHTHTYMLKSKQAKNKNKSEADPIRAPTTHPIHPSIHLITPLPSW